MKPFRAISVDDDASAHQALRALLAEVADVELAATCLSPAAAMAALGAGRCELLFLDVAMPQMSGLAFLQGLADPPVTVLLTAHVEHALTAFDLGVRDYLLKPVSALRLHRCLEHIRPLLAAARVDLDAKVPARIAIRCGNGHALVDPLRTLRVDAAGNFSVVHEQEREIFVSETMKDLEQRLAPFDFLRIHKSHLVNRRLIRKVSATDVQLADGSVVPIGRAYRAAVADAFAGTQPVRRGLAPAASR